MKKSEGISTAIAVLAIIVTVATGASAQNIHDTRLLTQPAISDKHIAFAYAGDLWIANTSGSEVRRLTSHIGRETNPRFSPDGSLVAFSAQYEGGSDVYVVPVEGGIPRRLTWHPGSDVVQSFTQDGEAVLFTSARAVFTNRFTQLFTVSVEGGHPEQLPIPNASKAAYSPDGSFIAYTPLGERFLQWKNYRGGTVSRIWIYNTLNHEVEQIPQPEGRCNDTDPMWLEDTVYFRSDRNGEFNLFSYNPRSSELIQLTGHDDFPILNTSAGGGRIVYEQAGYLHIYDPGTSSASKLTIGVAADFTEVRTRFEEGGNFIRNADISPSGARAVFEFRGEIVTVPAEKGDNRYITTTSGVHERSPAWSPDGNSIAFFSDLSGEYVLHIINQDGRGDVRTFPIEGAGFYEDPRW